jgi:bifunctional DNA-binding transcriptional regulator/antitoxin component of YhaV-PrlF toxin-antitoxin module
MDIHFTKYAVRMDGIQQYLVSASGQMSVPAAVRHRWHLDQGGPVDVIDLGFGVLTVPAGEAQRLLGDLLSREEHANYVESLANDPDLATT